MLSLSPEMIICCVIRSSWWEFPNLSASSGLLKFSSSNMNLMNFKIVVENKPERNFANIDKDVIVSANLRTSAQ